MDRVWSVCGSFWNGCSACAAAHRPASKMQQQLRTPLPARRSLVCEQSSPVCKQQSCPQAAVLSASSSAAASSKPAINQPSPAFPHVLFGCYAVKRTGCMPPVSYLAGPSCTRTGTCTPPHAYPRPSSASGKRGRRPPALLLLSTHQAAAFSRTSGCGEVCAILTLEGSD